MVNNTKDNATPRPWEVGRDKTLDVPFIKQAKNKIAVFPLGWDKAIQEANAALIVRAVNNHEALLDACRNALRQIEQVYTKGDPKTEGLCLSIRGLRQAIEQAEAVRGNIQD